MPHQNPEAPRATTQNAASPSTPASDRAVEQNRAVRPEPRTYAASKVADSSLAAPAAGEVSDYADDGDALGSSGLQQGSNHTRRPHVTEVKRGQGPKTLAANRRLVKSGSPDQSTR